LKKEGIDMKLLDMQGKVYAADEAIDVARTLQESDPDWKYVAETRGDLGRVMVYNENDQFVGIF
jgi:hypothetical protein